MKSNTTGLIQEGTSVELQTMIERDGARKINCEKKRWVGLTLLTLFTWKYSDLQSANTDDLCESTDKNSEHQ